MFKRYCQWKRIGYFANICAIAFAMGNSRKCQKVVIKRLMIYMGKTAAISRFGSGSELMTYVNAANQNWDSDSIKFEIVNTLNGAVEALSANKADYFMWNRLWRSPLLTKEFLDVWCLPNALAVFYDCCSKRILSEKTKTLVDNLLEIINQTHCEFKMIQVSIKHWQAFLIKN